MSSLMIYNETKHEILVEKRIFFENLSQISDSMTGTIPCRRQYCAVKEKGHPSIVTFLPNHTAQE